MTIRSLRILEIIFVLIIAAASGLAQDPVLSPEAEPATFLRNSREGLLARQMIAARSDEERAALLTNNGSFLNGNVVRAITEEAESLKGNASFPELERICGLAINLGEQIGDKREIARALLLLGNLQRGATDSIASYARGIKLSEAVGDQDLIANFLIAQGRRETVQNTQLDLFQRALRIAETTGSKKIEALALQHIGNNYRGRANYLTAHEYFMRSLTIREQIHDLGGISSSTSAIGIINAMQGDAYGAREYFQKSLDLSEKLGDRNTIGIDLYNLGISHYLMGDYGGAMSFYSRSIKLFEEIGADGGIEGVATNIANMYIAQGNFDQARAYLDRASLIHDKTGKEIPAYALGSYGDTYKGEGQIAKAIEFYKRLLILKEKNDSNDAQAETLVNIGNAYLLVPDASEAVKAFERALRLSEQTGNNVWISQALLGKAEAGLIRNDFQAARNDATVAKSHFEKLQGSKENWEVYVALGLAARGLGEKEEARRNFERAVAIVEDQRKHVAGGAADEQRFFQDKLSPYHLMIDSLVDAGRLEQAFQFAETAKARTLLESLGSGKVRVGNSMSVKEMADEQIFKNKLVSFNAQIDKERSRVAPDRLVLEKLQSELERMRLDFEDFQVKLHSTHPQLKSQRGEMKSLVLREATGMIKDAGSALLEYTVTENKVFLFVISRSANGLPVFKAYATPSANKDLIRKVEEFRTKLAAGDMDFQKSSREFYDLLLRPAETELAGRTKITIVPDGPLWDLPFQALMDEKGRYLIEKAAVSYAPSLTALGEMSKKAMARKPSPGTELLAFGNPIVDHSTKERVQRVFMGERLEPLPEAQRLVNELGKMYGPNRSKIYVGAQADEETAKNESPKYRIVQFATHGILNNASPMYSHLVLAQNEKDPNEDGLLEAWELKDLDLKADIVILSACDTARGRISNGEGVIGMTWAAFIAGAPTTVASQWKVESKSTTELMLEFHRQLLTGKVSKAEALRRAELKVMKMPGYKHPSYWAGFVIVGDGS
jgi:CHAT domain-containing protein/tetratricopeptide (TPR) repeat protein